MKKKYLIFWCILTGVMASCSDSATGSSTDGKVAVSSEPLTFLYQEIDPIRINQEDHSFVTGWTGCGENGSVETWYNEQEIIHYQIANGRLQDWLDGECDARVSKGQSSSIIGTWIPEPAEEVAPGFEECDGLDVENREDLPTSIEFTANTRVLTYQFTNYCWSETELRQFPKEGGNLRAEAMGCNKFQLTLTDGTVATWTLRSIDPAPLTVVYEVALNGATCTRHDRKIEETQATCAEAWASYQAAVPGGTSSNYFDEYKVDSDEEDFEACLKSAGWPYSQD